MSQPIDTAYVEVKPDLDRFAAELARKLTATLKQVQTAVDRSMRQTGERVAAAGQRAGQQFGTNFTRDATGRLQNARGRFAAEGSAAGQRFGDQFTRDATDRIRDARSRIAAAVGDDDSSLRTGRRIGARMAEGVTNALVKAGGPISDAIGGAFTALPPQAQAAIGAGVVAAVAAVAPAVGATVAGAVVAGVGTGAVAAGVAAAFQDARVKTAAQQLGDDVKAIFRGVGQDFAGDTVAALRSVRSAVRTLGLREVFAPAAGYLRPLTDGLIGLVRNVLPGLRSAIAAAEKPIRAIAAGLPQLGSAIGSLLQTFARHADAGAKALTLLFDVITFGVNAVEAQIGALATAFEWFDRLPTAITGLAGVWVDSADKGGKSTAEWDTRLQKLREELGLVGGEVGQTTRSVASLNQAFDQLFGSQLGVDQATIRYRDGLVELKEQLRQGARTLDENTATGRQHRQALLDQISAVGALRQARIADGVSVEQANRLYRDEIGALKQTASSAGYTSGQIYGLTAAYETIPDAVSTQVSVPGASGALSAVNSLKKRLQELDKMVVQPAILSPSTGFFGFSHGGLIRGPGTGTSDSITTRVSAGEFVVRAAAVQRPGVLPLLKSINAGRLETQAASARLAALTAQSRTTPASSTATAGSSLESLLGRLPTGSDQPILLNLTVQLGDEVIDQRVERIAGRLDQRNNTALARGLNYRPRTV